MDLPRESETRRRESSRTPAVINRRNTPVNTMYAVGFLCLQVLSIQAAAIQFTKEPKSQDALHWPQLPCYAARSATRLTSLTAGSTTARPW
ncbi:hypothetical protein E3U43_009887 [Larimichthys crocea]|uniref:Uncharacterized protein n=1 Tax=Larimichthys crocea TaxID=215358 RepID=A0ACD3QC51_LARCR|nr:hypothetical protein E3U43_009887 [Larimichthys crocea]